MFIAFMSWIHGQDYALDHEFSVYVIGELTPLDITRFFKFKVFLISVNQDIIAATLDMHKKSISDFMPNSISTWDRTYNRGNPTK
jgi:hypothetical protein